MTQSLSQRTLFATLATILAIGIGGCSSSGGGSSAQSSAPTLPTVPFAPSTTSTTPASQEPADYQSLLLTAADLSDAEDTFSERSKESQPNGSPGATAFFVNAKDDRAIADTFMVYPDAATATATLKQAAGTIPTLVTGGSPKPLAVGTDGVTVSGTNPQNDQAVTLVFFTEGRALVRLEFQSATGDATTDQFVTTIGKLQQVALRVGLSDSP